MLSQNQSITDAILNLIIDSQIDLLAKQIEDSTGVNVALITLTLKFLQFFIENLNWKQFFRSLRVFACQIAIFTNLNIMLCFNSESINLNSQPLLQTTIFVYPKEANTQLKIDISSEFAGVFGSGVGRDVKKLPICEMNTTEILLEEAKQEILQVLYRAEGQQMPGSNILTFNLNDWRLSAPTANRQVKAIEKLEELGYINISPNTKVITLTREGKQALEDSNMDSSPNLRQVKSKITPKLKDQILDWIIEQPDDAKFVLVVDEVVDRFALGRDMLNEMLIHFENMNLIHCHRLAGGAMLVTIKTKAYDFQALGGFCAEFKRLELSLQKLKLELINLKGQVEKDNFDIVMTSINTIMAAMSLLK